MRISDWSSDVCSSDLPIVLARRKLDHAQRLAHAPAGDHLAGNGRRLLYVAFGAGGAGAVDDFLRGATAQHADDLRAQISLGIVVAVGLRSLVSDADYLAAGHDGGTMDRSGAGHAQTKDRVPDFDTGRA